MNNQPLIEKTITVAELNLVDGNIKIKDEKGLTYTIWQTKQNGEKTMAYANYEKMGISLNQVIDIKHDEKPTSSGKGFYRSIKMIGAGNNQNVSEPQNTPPISTNPPQNAPQGQISRNNTPLIEHKPAKSEEQKWHDINYGKCKHQFLIQMMKWNLKESGLSNVNLGIMEKDAETWAEMSMRILSKETPDVTMEDVKDEHFEPSGGDMGESARYF